MLKPQSRCCCSQIFRSNKMKVWNDVKRRRAGAQIQVSTVGRCMVIALLLILGGSFNVVRGQTQYYWTDDLAALQTLWGAWNQSTPELGSNLAGWSSEDITGVSSIYPCQSLVNPDATTPNWRGIFCLKTNITTNSSNVEIIGLKLQNASIAGTLPVEIGNLTSMTTLELTGNPKLTGPLPATLSKMWLNILDVHDNGFSGPLPDGLNGSWNILQLDISGNKFTGGYPFEQTRTMDYLQKLSIGRNLFEGEIPVYAFENKTEVEYLDISDNKFNGTLPPLANMSKYLIHLDVSGNHFEGKLPDLRNFTALQHVNLGRNKFTGTADLSNILSLMRKTNASDDQIEFVDLSHNNLDGPIPSWNFSNLGTIQELYMDDNRLSGTFNLTDMYIQGFLLNEDSSDKKLRIMSLINNTITHVIYNPFIIDKVATVFKLQGNPYCAKYDPNNDGQRCFCTQICFVTPPKTDSRKIIIIAATTSVVAVALILLVVIGAILYKNRRYKKYLQLEFKQKFEEFDVKPTIFSYSELKAATRDFSEENKLGQGGYGAVYKGTLPNGNVVAVKQLFIKQAQNASLDDFSNEVVLITGMKHRNLVNLKGCCLRESQRLLVYEYVDNYDVDQIVLGSRRRSLTWSIRLKICLGVARGLHYLHALAHPRVIHRDIKASNVLLDKNLEPKIADFGLALLFPDNQSHIMTVHVAGTKGYLAPEYASLGQLSDKVDVFSFGVLCLEIISGRRNIVETAPLDQVYLSKWAWLLHDQNKLADLIDPQMNLTEEEARDVLRVISVCLLCIQNKAEKRPTMARVVSILQSDTESEITVLGEGNEPTYKPSKSRSKSVDLYKSIGLESVMEDIPSSHGGSSGSNGHRRDSNPSDLSVAVELSEIRAR